MLFSNITLPIVREYLVCDTKQLSQEVYQFDGFGFYNALEQPNYWQNHGHEEIQITLPQTNANAWIECQSSTGKMRQQRIELGQAFLVSQHQFHELNWQNPAELTLFYLHPRFFCTAIDDSIENNHFEVGDRFCLVNDILIQEVGVIFRYLCSKGVAGEKLYLESLANLLAVHLLKNYLNHELKVPSLERGLSPKKLDSVLQYIEANLDRKITLSKLANIAGVGKFYFSRLFKSSLGLTPYQYVIRQRVGRAKKLLTYSNVPICDIALDCGFSSQSHLAKHFRSMVKASPMSYRKSSK